MGSHMTKSIFSNSAQRYSGIVYVTKIILAKQKRILSLYKR